MKFKGTNEICLFTLLLMWFFNVSAEISSESTLINFCNICDTTTKKCFENGLYQWFAQPWPTRDNPETYDNYVSILPPFNKTRCKIEISYNDQVLDDILILTKKEKGEGTNNIWTFEKEKNYRFQYKISRRINIKG